MTAPELLGANLISSPLPFTEGAVAVFEQKLALPDGGAVLFITALGLYEAELDGVKLGDRLFTPGFTYYPRDLFYQRYELPAGAHTLRVYLAQGWYCGRFTFENKTRLFGETPAVSWAVTDQSGALLAGSADGSVTELESPYGYAGFYDGEVFTGKRLTPADHRPVRSDAKLPEQLEESFCSVRIRREMPIVSVTDLGGGRTLLDFGQNFAGFLTVDPEFMSGPELRLRHGELTNADGTLYTANLRAAKAELVYRKGDDPRIFRPRFTYMGFRYAELSGVPYREGLLRAFAIWSDMEPTGTFSCAQPLVDRLFRNQLWSQRSNYIEVPTDCPQRDERMGYTGDGQVFAPTGAYNYDTRSFWRKFLKDIRMSQQDCPDGYVTPTVPPVPAANKVGFLSMMGWGSCVCTVPELMYRQFGDRSFLEEQYDSMKRFVGCELAHTGGFPGRKDLWMQPNLGDWLAPGKGMGFMAMHHGPVSNAFLVGDLDVMARTARLLGRPEDAAFYEERLARSRAAYLRAFVRRSGRMKDNYQGAYVMALAKVLEPGALRDRVFRRLAALLRRDGLGTGFFATRELLPLLAENGEAALAYDLLLSEDCPGWMYQLRHGATTIWERWDAIRPDGSVNEEKSGGDNMVSFNHYAFGSVGEFYYEYILGIKSLEPGFRRVRIRPFPDARLGRAEGSYRSVSGEIRVAWELRDGRTRFRLSVPVPAEFVFPDGTARELPPGEHSLVFPCNEE